MLIDWLMLVLKHFRIYYIWYVKNILIYLQRTKYLIYPGFSMVLTVARST